MLSRRSAAVTANRWRLGEVLGRAGDTDWSRALPGAGLGYAVGAGAVLAAATALWGPRPGMIVAAGAVNAGTVGTTPGLARPRAAMGVSLAALAAAAFLGMVTARRPALSVVTLVLLGAVAGLLARTGQAASTTGTQAMVGFVILGRSPQPPDTAGVLAAGIVAGGLAQILPGLVLRGATPGSAVPHRASAVRPGPAPDVGCPPVGEAVRSTGRALVSTDPQARWHAVRLALGLALAQAAAVWLLPAQRGYWITLTVLNVLKPAWVTTASRGVDRWVGTLIGVLVVGGVADAVGLRGVALVAAVTALLWGAFALQPVNYALFCACIAGYVVLFLQVMAAPPGDSAVYRAVDTTLGGLLALFLHAWVRRPGSRPSSDRPGPGATRNG
ncbi:FUSC family protein [Streptomyces sp. NPDC046727]|uniref:FUSC family protein n=1 Tax=Streptomyces sp. NPDC046727 TaxID=3155373 RepID=UPI0033E6784E